MGTMGDVRAYVEIRANAENACTGGSDDQCGAYMELKTNIHRWSAK